MANNESNNNVSKKAAMDLMPTAYSVNGLSPVSSKFRLTPDQLKKEILTIAKTFIPDFTDCTLAHSRSGMLVAYLWLPQNSNHLADQIGNDNSVVITKPIFRFSNDIKEFMDKFCRKENKRTFNEDRPSGGVPKVALEVEIIKFMYILFDTNGYQFSKVSGSKATRTDIKLEANFNSDGNKMGAFAYLTVEKFLPNNFVRKEPVPRKSYNV